MAPNNARATTKKSGLPKRDLRDIEAAAAAGRRKAAKSTAKQVAGVGSTGSVNSYLAGLADPRYAGKGSKIPDSETIPSVAFQTTYSDAAKVDGAGRLLAFHAPTLQYGGFHPALRGDEVFMIHPASPSEAAITYTNFKLHDIIPANTLQSIRTNFAAIRPVSMSMEFTPTEALLNASGFVFAGVISREQCMGNMKLSSGGADGPGVSVGMAAVDKVSDYISGAQYQASVTKPFTLLWRFEDPDDFRYRETIQDTWLQVAAANPAYAPFAKCNTQSALVIPSICEDTSGNQNLWFVPGGFTAQMQVSTLTTTVISRPYAQYTYPSVFWGVEGATFGATIGEVKFTINWEGLPVAGTASIMSATPSPTSPLEMAQAQNVVPSMPVAYDATSTSQPENQIVQAVKKAATENPSTPSGVKGASVAKKVAGFAARGLSTVLPFPLSLLASGAEAFVEAL